MARHTLSRILNGQAGISPEMAIRLEKAGWSNADHWMRVQAAYDLARLGPTRTRSRSSDTNHSLRGDDQRKNKTLFPVIDVRMYPLREGLVVQDSHEHSTEPLFAPAHFQWYAPMQMKDGDLRGIILEKFYEVRNLQPSWVNPLGLPGLGLMEPDRNRLLNICEQLGEHGLIHWKSLNTMNTVGGMGKISASGVDVVEGTARAPITVFLHDHSISVTGSSNVQIGDSNIQDVRVQTDSHDLARLVTGLTEHLDELNLEALQKERAQAQIAALRVELSGGEPDPAIVKQAGGTLRSITEGAIGSLLATAAIQPTVWQRIHHMLESL